MKLSFLSPKTAGLLLINFGLVLPAFGASFSLSPNTVSNTYSGYFTLQIGGLTNREPVVVENYFDINGNGVLDAADMLMESYQITEGQRSLIGGATNVGAPGDWTGPDGSITSYVPFRPAQPQQGMGKHLVRVSSPTSNFSALTNSLVITNWTYPQSISGTVKSASTNIPFAMVAILAASTDGQGNLVAMAVTDNAGAYSLRLPVGDYQVLAFRPGYVFSAATGPQVSLAAGVNWTQNLTLLPASQPFVGRVVDSANTNLPIPGLFMVLQSASGLLAVASTDPNGYFRATVVPDGWQVSLDGSSLGPLGYVRTKGSPGFDTTAGPVTDATITLVKATAMIYGTIRNATNGPLGGLSFYGNDNTDTFESTGWSDPAGNYSVAVTPGDWWVGLDSWALPPNSILGGTDKDTLVAGQAVRRDLGVVVATTSIRGTVRNVQGQPVAGLYLWSNTQQNGINYNSNAQTDLNGNYVLNAFNGLWFVGVQCTGNNGVDSLGYQCPYQPSRVAIPPANPVLDFTLFPVGSPKLDPPVFTSSSQVVLGLLGVPGTNYVVQYSTNIFDPTAWRTLTTFIATNTVNTVWDHNATGKARFYRAGIWR